MEAERSRGTRKGPVNDARSNIARRFKSSVLTQAAAAREFLDTVRSPVESGIVAGPDAGQPREQSYAIRPLRNRDAAFTKMTPAQIAEAEQLTRTWKPTWRSK